MKRCKKTNKEKDGDVNEDEDTEDIDDEYEELDVVTMLTNFLLTHPLVLSIALSQLIWCVLLQAANDDEIEISISSHGCILNA